MTKLAHSPLPPLGLLQELFVISSDSPSGLRWKSPRARNVKVGQIAGRMLPDGYWQVTIKTDTKKLYRTHRIVYFLQTKIDPGKLQVDHIFGKQDNLNLRLATASENQINSKKHKEITGKQCSSQFKGVSWDKHAKKWQARVMFQGKRNYLGLFINETDAAKAYNEAAIKFFGEYALLNDV
jgi:hypothetical protein